MMYGYYGQSLGWGFIGWIMMVVIMVAAVVFVVWFVRELRNDNRGDFGRAKDAVDILKERYAKGEIDKVEFEAKKKDLISNSS